MEPSPDQTRTVSRASVFVCLSLLTVPWFFRPGAFSVWDANEAFYVQTPREMVESGNWLIPTFNGHPRLNKPPLSYWVVAPWYRWFGFDPAWERRTMAAAAVGCLVLVYAVACRLWRDRRAALLAAAILGATFRFQTLGRRLLIDTLLLWWACLFLWCFLRWEESRRPLWAAAAGAAVGFGILTKGPVIGLPVSACVLWLLLAKRLRSIRRSDVVAFSVPAVLIGLSWFACLAWSYGRQPVLDFFLKENVGRYASMEFGPRRPIWYYVPVFVADAFPWSLLFLAALPAVVRYSRPSRGTLGSHHRGTGLLVVWVAVIFVFFSLSLNKQEYYIAPLYPAVAVLLGGILVSRESGFPRTARLSALLLAVVLSAAAVVIVRFDLSGRLWIPWAFLAAGTAACLRGRWGRTAAFLNAGFLSAALLLPEVVEPWRPVKPLAEQIQRLAPATGRDDWVAGYFRFTAPSLRVYLDRPVLELFEPEEAAAALTSDRPVFLLAEARDLETLQWLCGPRAICVAARRPRPVLQARALRQALERRDPQHLFREVLLVTNFRPPPDGADGGRLSSLGRRHSRASRAQYPAGGLSRPIESCIVRPLLNMRP